MTEKPKPDCSSLPDPPFKPFLKAALYAAAVVGIAIYFEYDGSTYGIGFFAGAIAFGVAFFCALILALPFHLARNKLAEAPYFLLHLIVGIGIGALRATQNPYTNEWHHYIYNYDALLVSCASLAAWLYVVLHVPPGRPKLSRTHSAIVAGSPVALLAGLVLLPIPIIHSSVPADPSCHNSFRGGRTTARASIRMTISVKQTDKAALSSVYDRFAKDFDLSSRGHPLLPESTQRNMCNDDVKISAGGTHSNGKHSIGFYPHIGGASWEPMASELVCRLESKWGASLTFTGGGGEVISRPSEISQECANEAEYRK